MKILIGGYYRVTLERHRIPKEYWLYGSDTPYKFTSDMNAMFERHGDRVGEALRKSDHHVLLSFGHGEKVWFPDFMLTHCPPPLPESDDDDDDPYIRIMDEIMKFD